MLEYIVMTNTMNSVVMRIDGPDRETQEISSAIEVAVATARIATGPCDDQMTEFQQAMLASGFDVTFDSNVSTDIDCQVIEIPIQ